MAGVADVAVANLFSATCCWSCSASCRSFDARSKRLFLASSLSEDDDDGLLPEDNESDVSRSPPLGLVGLTNEDMCRGST